MASVLSFDNFVDLNEAPDLGSKLCRAWIINGIASHRLRAQALAILSENQHHHVVDFLNQLEACNPSTWKNLASKENIWDEFCVNAYSASNDPGTMFEEIRRRRMLRKICPAQKKGAIIHYVSKKAMDIQGIGDKLISRLVEENLVNNISDLYKLNEKNLKDFILNKAVREDSGKEYDITLGDKSIKNILQSIKSRMNVNLSNFIFSLGISEVGEVTARSLAERYTTIDKLIQANYEDIIQLRDIGPIAARNISSYFKDKRNIKIINNIIRSGLQFNEIKKNTSNTLFDETYVITGKLKNMSRAKLKDYILNNGGYVSNSVTKKTDALIVGENPGSKLQKAKDLGIMVINEEKFYEKMKI